MVGHSGYSTCSTTVDKPVPKRMYSFPWPPTLYEYCWSTSLWGLCCQVFYYYFDKTFWWVYSGIIVILMNIYQVVILNNFSSFHGAFGSYFVFQIACSKKNLHIFLLCSLSSLLLIRLSSIHKCWVWKVCHLYVKIDIFPFCSLPSGSLDDAVYHLNIVHLFNSFLWWKWNVILSKFKEQSEKHTII